MTNLYKFNSNSLASEFAKAWFVASMPVGLSKEALGALMQSYYQFTEKLKTSILYDIDNASIKMGKAYQTLTDVTKTSLTNKNVGSALVGGLLLYQLYSIYTLLSDNTLKTRAQQSSANLKLAIAASTAISLSFRFAVTYSEHGNVSESILSRFKFSGNLFGFLSGLIKAGADFNEDLSDKSFSEKGLFWLSYGTEIIGTIDLFFQLSNRSLIEVVNAGSVLIKPLIKSNAMKFAASVLIDQILIGLLKAALNPWVNLGLFLFQLLIELKKDDDMQLWLRRCRFGWSQLMLDGDYRYCYRSKEQELAALKAIFEKFEKQAAEYQAEQDAIKAEKNRKAIEQEFSHSWQNFNSNSLRFL